MYSFDTNNERGKSPVLRVHIDWNNLRDYDDNLFLDLMMDFNETITLMGFVFMLLYVFVCDIMRIYPFYMMMRASLCFILLDRFWNESF